MLATSRLVTRGHVSIGLRRIGPRRIGPRRIYRPGTLVLLLALVGCARPEQMIIAGVTMGTTYTVKIADPEVVVTKQVLARQIQGTVDRIDQLMSTYKQDSELSRFNQAPIDDWFELSEETSAVVDLALEIAELSDGSFDITVGPLVNLWGFGPATTRSDLPSPEEIMLAKTRVGFSSLMLDSGRLKKTKDVYVDLSALAKGFAVDQIAEQLDELEIGNYLVEIGGELRGKGLNWRGKPWKVAIESPFVEKRSVYRAIRLDGLSIATSGDYRNFFVVDGVRYSHTIDPKTGYPVSQEVASVTVLHPNAVNADALATAFNAMGLKRGLRLAEAKGFAVMFVVRKDDEFADVYSTAFEALLAEDTK